MMAPLDRLSPSFSAAVRSPWQGRMLYAYNIRVSGNCRAVPCPLAFRGPARCAAP